MTGIGYDVHQLVTNRPLVLGGVTIPHSHGLAGHSDADVLCHAIADAILGAMGEPDIGHFFPPDDPACKDMSSLRILEKCRELAGTLGHTIINVDSTLIAEAPRILRVVAQLEAKSVATAAVSAAWMPTSSRAFPSGTLPPASCWWKQPVARSI